LFFFRAALWAYHHVVKQHFGFVALYRAKGRQFDKQGFAFLKWYLIVSLWAPVVLALGPTPSWFAQLPLALVWARGAEYERVVAITTVLGNVCLAVFWLAQVALGAWLLREVKQGRGLNVPVLLILLASVPLSYVVALFCLKAALAGPP